MNKDFKSYELAEIFSDVYHAERTGLLVLTRTDEEKRVFFDRGMLVSADSSVDTENLGAVLVSDGRLSAGAVTEAQATLADDATARDLARVLVQRDLIGRSAVTSAMSEIVERVVMSAFGWESGHALFRDEPPAETLFETDIVTTLGWILAGIFRMNGFEAVSQAMRGLSNRIRLRDPMPIPLERLTLSATHGFILSRVDGATGLADLLAIVPPEEEETAARFLFGLLVLHVLEFDPPLGDATFAVNDLVRLHADQQTLERVQERTIRQKYDDVLRQNSYELLGITPSASRSEIERAYEQVKLQYSREWLTPKVREKLRSELTLIESRLVEAFLTVTQPERTTRRPDSRPKAGAASGNPEFAVRVELDRTKSQVEVDQATQIADRYFAKGRKCVREGDFHNAIQYGKLAISHHPSDARYYCLLADCQARNPEVRWQRMAEENYTRATQLDPWNPEYWMSLGRLYKKRGMHLRARRNFEEALKLVPNKPEILDEIAGLKG